MEKLLHGQVIQIEQDERSRNYLWERNARLLDPNIQVVSIDDYNEYLRSCNQNVPSVVSPGSVLVKHPFNEDTYIDIETSEQAIYSSKAHHIADIAQLLGCKHFTYDLKIDSIEKASIQANGEISYAPYASADAKYKSGQIEKYKEMLKLDDNNIPNEHKELTLEEKILSYNQACNLAKKYGLDKEDDVQSLLDSRNPQNLYLKKSRTVCFELSKEVNALCSCAYSLNVLQGVFTTKGNFESHVSTKKTIFLTITFEF